MTDFEKSPSVRSVEELVHKSIDRATLPIPPVTLDKRNILGSGRLISETGADLLGWSRIRDLIEERARENKPSYDYTHARLVISQEKIFKRGKELEEAFTEKYRLEILNNFGDVELLESLVFDPLTVLHEDDLIIKALNAHLEDIETLRINAPFYR
jgi:hypothetical protein